MLSLDHKEPSKKKRLLNQSLWGRILKKTLAFDTIEMTLNRVRIVAVVSSTTECSLSLWMLVVNQRPRQTGKKSKPRLRVFFSA
jgi:hypothetical protein